MRTGASQGECEDRDRRHLQNCPADNSSASPSPVPFWRSPQCLFADEPTGSLDRDSAVHLIGLLRSLADERAATFVVVTHDRELAEVVDDVLHVVDGRSRGTATRREGASRPHVPAQVTG